MTMDALLTLIGHARRWSAIHDPGDLPGQPDSGILRPPALPARELPVGGYPATRKASHLICRAIGSRHRKPPSETSATGKFRPQASSSRPSKGTARNIDSRQ
ncbi:hypothetical protein DC28_06285 [Spirochaeta lutea]|uniref:Uncharacterized protein n=2 Tax=Spirochaeta lutea TaxID=1480694 RepID=A0A098QYY6_9SPIO|nr:hypothetical protein DC28_06285 [Spirochaeta lutea]